MKIVLLSKELKNTFSLTLYIAEGWNGVLKYNDPTLHAEVDAIRKACSALQSRTLEGCEIYTTLEPCAMCAAAIFYSKLVGDR